MGIKHYLVNKIPEPYWIYDIPMKEFNRLSTLGQILIILHRVWNNTWLHREIAFWEFPLVARRRIILKVFGGKGLSVYIAIGAKMRKKHKRAG